MLENGAAFPAFWSKTGLLPPADRQKCTDEEQSVVTRATVTVVPSLAEDADLLAPWATLRQPLYETVHGPQVALHIMGSADAMRIYAGE